MMEWVAIHSQGIFPTQGLNPGLLYYRQILYHLSHQGTPGTEDMEIKKKPFLTATCSAPSVWVPRSVPVLKAEKR